MTRLYAIRGVVTHEQLDSLPRDVYAELQVFDPSTGSWSEYGAVTDEGLLAQNPSFDEFTLG